MTMQLDERVNTTPVTGYSPPQIPASFDNFVVTSIFVSDIREMSVESLVSPGTGYRLATDTRHRDFSESLRSIQQRSGLDWGQIAQVLGVSRRTIHNWISGAIVNGENAKRITALYNALIQELRGIGPADVRSYLLSPAADGTTRLSTISSHIRQQYKRTRPAVSARELLAYSPAVDVPTQTGGLDESVAVIIVDEGDES